MKTLSALMFFSFMFIFPCFCQQDLLPAYPREISYSGDIAYYNGSPFTGLLVDEKTNKQLGEFRNGYKNGVFTGYYKNGKKKNEGKFINGKQEGKYASWYNEGTLEYEVNFKDGNKEGPEIYYHSNGKIKATYNYSGGKIIIGTYSIYDNNGALEKKEHYEYKVCNFCNGEGKQTCSDCSGTGKLTCRYCTNGKVTCNSCYGKGTISCNICRGSGSVNICPICDGTGVIKKNVFVGIVTYTCTNCNGTGRGNFQCANCNGTGTLQCNACSGQGTLYCSYCNGLGYKNCSRCSGTGKTTANCSYCGGTGKSSEVMMTEDNQQYTASLSETILKQQAVPESAPEENTKPFLIVEQMPEFLGGTEDLKRFIHQNLKYPQLARETGISGTVYVQFVVSKYGKIYDVKVLRGIGGGCDEEAIEVIKSMPNWRPGKQNGVAVPVYFKLPIKFPQN